MRYYCPGCWQDFWNEDFAICPQCGYAMKAHNDKKFAEKLLHALQHRSGEVRHWVIMILVLRKEKQAIPYLAKLAEESKDPSLVRAAREAMEKIAAGT